MNLRPLFEKMLSELFTYEKITEYYTELMAEKAKAKVKLPYLPADIEFSAVAFTYDGFLSFRVRGYNPSCKGQPLELDEMIMDDVDYYDLTEFFDLKDFCQLDNK